MLNMFKTFTVSCTAARAYSSAGPKKVAVILSGSGVFDGTEIHEASATLVHLSRLNYQPVCYAPDIKQMHVIDHSKGAESSEERNVLSESARIARGNIQPISELNPTDIAAAVFPGGFGAAKNLSTFATEGANCTLNNQVERVIKEFHSQKRPLAFMCIAPILAARAIPGVELTLGKNEGDQWPHAGAIEAAKALGARVQLCNVEQVCIDKVNLVVTTPAFMFDGQFCQIFDGIGNLLQALDGLIKQK